MSFTFTGINAFARNTNIVSGIEEDMWNNGGVWNAPTQARTHNIGSTNIQDINTSGTGARTVVVDGIGSDYLTKRETVLMSGTTNVLTTGSYLRINSLFVETAGTSGVNIGTIAASGTTDNTVTADIAARYGSSAAIYTVPSGHTAYINQYYGAFNSINTGGTANFLLKVRKGIDGSNPIFEVKHSRGLAEGSSSEFNQPFNPAIRVPQMSDIKITVIPGASTIADVSAGFDLELKPN